MIVAADDETKEIDLPKLSPGLTTLTASLLDAAGITVGAVTFAIEYDSTGPNLIEPIYNLEGSNAAKLTLRFDDPIKEHSLTLISISSARPPSIHLTVR